MKNSYEIKFSWKNLLYSLLLVVAIWIVYWLELRFGWYLNHYGVLPRDMVGLRGIVFSPFIHSSLDHLASNSVPLFVLSLALFYFYKPISWQVILYGLVLSGFITWLIGRPSTHIGASGVVYMLVSFLFFKGIWSKNYRLIALSLVVVFLYGSMIWGIFPQEERISWEGHLSGLIAGVLLAIYYRSFQIKVKKYRWQVKDSVEDDDFLKQFDENGNFIPASELEEEPETEFTKDSTETDTATILYEYVSKEKKNPSK